MEYSKAKFVASFDSSKMMEPFVELRFDDESWVASKCEIRGTLNDNNFVFFKENEAPVYFNRSTVTIGKKYFLHLKYNFFNIHCEQD